MLKQIKIDGERRVFQDRSVCLHSRDLARNEEFSEIAVINIFLQFSKQKHSYLLGGGYWGENFEISHAIDM